MTRSEGVLDDADARWLTELCNRLDMVRWDRMAGPSAEQVDVFGWIARDDGRSDFVNLHLWLRGRLIAFVTSSAEHSQRIAELLYPPDNHASMEHESCLRVEHVLGAAVINAIRLGS